jgi:hypothetical protein
VHRAATATVLHYILGLFGLPDTFSDLPAIHEIWSVLGATPNTFGIGNLLEHCSSNLYCRIVRYYGEDDCVSRGRTEYSGEQKCCVHYDNLILRLLIVL